MTKIEWTHYTSPTGQIVKGFTWNPAKGCSKAAFQPVDGGPKKAHPGCQHCYAESFCGRNLHGEKESGVARWDGTIETYPERLAWPFERFRARRDGLPRIGFTHSESDPGHPSYPEEFWMAVQGAMLLSPWVVWKDLTKRPERQSELLKRHSPAECIEVFRSFLTSKQANGYLNRRIASFEDCRVIDIWNWRHGKRWEEVPYIRRYISVSDQPTADALIPLLLQMPAAVRGVSLEPMTGPVSLGQWFACTCERDYSFFGLERHVKECQRSHMFRGPRINHVIIGGESGRGARPFDLAWAEDVIKQCRTAGVPVYMKQTGSNPVVHATNSDRGLFPPHPMTLTDWARCHIRIFGGRVEGNDTILWPKLTGKGGDPSEWPEALRVRQHVGLPESCT